MSRSDEPGWALDGVWHSIDYEYDADRRRQVSGLCVCGRKLVSESGQMKLYCRKVARALRAARAYYDTEGPQRPPSLAGWTVRLVHEYDGWRWMAWRKFDEPKFLGADRYGRKHYDEPVHAVAVVAAMGATRVEVCVGYPLWSPSDDDLVELGRTGALVRVTYGH